MFHLLSQRPHHRTCSISVSSKGSRILHFQFLHEDSTPRCSADRSGTRRKVHDWRLCGDIHKGTPDVIQSVTFDLGGSDRPKACVCSSPVKVGSVWRFSTRQQSYGPNKGPKATTSLFGAGGTKVEKTYQVKHTNYCSENFTFSEDNPGKSLRLVTVASNQRFGIELELTNRDRDLHPSARKLTSLTRGRFGEVEVVQNYNDARSPSDVWRMVPDSSIACSEDSPGCATFELVSPILSGEQGLQDASHVLNRLKDAGTNLQVNKSMGFHVHVDVSSLSLSGLKKVCQNFVKYEEVMDALMPPSRRTGSPESEIYFRSNKAAIANAAGNYPVTGKGCHGAIEGCSSVQELASLMNPDDSKYYKLNLQNLANGRQHTIEFRQHSATSNSSKMQHWARFCLFMVHNSARLKTPRPFRKSRDLDFRFDGLFQWVIKDRVLRAFYAKRRKHLEQQEAGDGCCEDCQYYGRIQ